MLLCLWRNKNRWDLGLYTEARGLLKDPNLKKGGY